MAETNNENGNLKAENEKYNLTQFKNYIPF